MAERNQRVECKLSLGGGEVCPWKASVPRSLATSAKRTHALTAHGGKSRGWQARAARWRHVIAQRAELAARTEVAMKAAARPTGPAGPLNIEEILGTVGRKFTEMTQVVGQRIAELQKENAQLRSRLETVRRSIIG